MRNSVLRRIEVALTVGGLALVMAGCSQTASASVQGYVVRYGPVAPASPFVATTTTLPLARGTSTVQARSDGKVVAVQKVPSGGQFHFVLPPGTYNLIVIQDMTCHAQVALRSSTTTRANIRCVEP